ncbi:MAG: translation elongation factor Ts [Candidatus Gracilibacteria bacterium]|nr:translation elongation factor Ts [Candidatus Gracilibacteria bacterium]
MAVTLESIKELRELTGVSTMTCKKALEEAEGDINKAVELLRKRGEAKAIERSDRSASQGVVVTYIHSNNRLGVMVHLGCETDFVARNEEFMEFGKDIAMHIAAMNPMYVKPEEVQHELIEKEQDIWKSQLQQEGKPEGMWEKIMLGKEKKFREEAALLTQAFVKNPETTVGQLLTDLGLKMGENIQIVRFVRFSI